MTAPALDRRMEMRGTLATFYQRIAEAAEAERSVAQAAKAREMVRIAKRAEQTGQPGILTMTEARIMATLQAAYPRWLDGADLMGIVHGFDGATRHDKALARAHITNIRRKLGYNAIHSRRNRGYLQGVIA